MSTKPMKSSPPPTKMRDVVVIGGGPAGMMAAIAAAERQLSVTLIDKNPYLGKKLNITGKGRCNLTNNCSPAEVVANTPRGGRFLYSALAAFPPADVMQWFEQRGLPLKTERGNRVFPQSDRARDVTDTLHRELKRLKVDIMHDIVQKILISDGAVVGIDTLKTSVVCKGVILATGGLSYPLTGSTGDGYSLASLAGHGIHPTLPSIVPLESTDSFCAKLSGLTLKNVKVKAFTATGKQVYEDFGELLFTHFGISGPLTLSMSAHLCEFDKTAYHVTIDLKPALDVAKLDTRILRDFSAQQNRSLSNMAGGLLPASMVPVVLEQAGLDGAIQCNAVTREQRRALVCTLKSFRVNISGARPIDEAVVTSGGVETGQIDPKTMGSKLVKNLYFAGEVIDADAYTGGFNLQIAWSTGRAAGAHVLEG